MLTTSSDKGLTQEPHPSTQKQLTVAASSTFLVLPMAYSSCLLTCNEREVEPEAMREGAGEAGGEEERGAMHLQ